MSTTSVCAYSREPSGLHRPAPLRLLVLAASFLFFTAGPSHAGECLMSDDDLLQGIMSFAETAKKSGWDAPYYGSSLYCWSGSTALNAKLRSVLTDLLFDSRIHPAHVAAALNDYESVFNDVTNIHGEVKKKQGPERYALITAFLNRAGASAPAAAVPDETFSADTDFIDGPANIRKSPKGALVASLPDNTKVRILRYEKEWAEIEASGVRGWTSRTNLMSSHVAAPDADGFYVLSRAAYSGYAGTVRFLLARGAKPDLLDSFGRSALHWAVRGGFAGRNTSELEMVKLLAPLAGVTVNCVDAEGMTPLLTAVTLGRTDMTSVLLGMPEIDVNLPGEEGSTPLMRALQYDRADIAAALLGVRGLNPDAVDERGRTALHHAVALGDQKSVAMLLERKARTDMVTKEGTTLLHAALAPKPGRLSSDPANIEIVKILLDRRGVDINGTDAKGDTVMSLAIEQDNAQLVKLLLTRPDLDVNKPTRNGGRYLHRVIGLSNLQHGYEMAMLLLDRPEIDVNAPGPGYSAKTVVFMDWYNVGFGEHGIALAKKILAHKPNLNARDKYGETPLIYNINQDHVEMVRLLASAPGIDLDRRDEASGKTPLALATYRGRKEIVDILIKAGAREFPLVGDAEQTPEGIPQALLQNEAASQAIVFYRGYLLSTTDKTLKLLREKKTDDAVQLQEFILDEIIAEMGDYSMPKYSAEQRKRAISTFTSIRDHYRSYPRTESAWFRALPADKKAGYEKLDMMCDEIITGKYEATPDGELVQHPPMVPILILRDYMARNSIQALAMMKKGKTAKAEVFLQEIIDRSKQAGFDEQ